MKASFFVTKTLQKLFCKINLHNSKKVLEMCENIW